MTRPITFKSLPLTLLLVTMLAGAGVHAADKKKGGEGQREAPELGAAVGKQINDAIELLNAKNPAGAKAAIGKADFDGAQKYVYLLMGLQDKPPCNTGSPPPHGPCGRPPW